MPRPPAEPPDGPIDPEPPPRYGLLNRPFGLPRHITVADYLADPVCKLSGINYKVEAHIGPKAESLQQILTVLDTGAAPNLIRANMLPQELLDNADTKREVANLMSASNHSLDTVGIVRLTVRLGGRTYRQPFVVVRNLGTDAIIGTTFLDDHVVSIHVRRRTVELDDENFVPIEKRAARPPTTTTYEEDPRCLQTSSC